MADNNAHDLGAMIGSIYEAALDSRRWNQFLAMFAARLGSHAAMIWGHDFSDRSAQIDGRSGSIATHYGIDPAAMESFAEYYCQRNVWMDDPLRHKEGQIVTSASLYPDELLKRTEYYNDWLRPQNIFNSSAAIVARQDDRSLNVTVVRSEQAGSYSREELQVIEILMPHLQAAFALHRRLHRLEVLSGATIAALEASPFGVVLIDEKSRVLHANSLAERLTARSPLLRLASQNRLQAVSVLDDAALQRCLDNAVQTGRGQPAQGAGAGLRLRGLDGACLELVVAPLPGWASPFGEHTAAAVFISNPDAAPAPLSAMLRSLYGMTPAEARLTEALVHGLTPQEYAERQQLSLHTVRVQFKAAAHKAGTSRQADLVRIVLTGPAVLGAGYRW
ncbi:PAS domain-containing protein [Pseudomonas sp. 21LCFQ010]|uniref:helix-turn-helix transcriptional regulator n=1 Tax=Pseudomonas sp. 21LCFQ010 TaxID=2957506 RepID=UPI002096D1E0|nr:PAS domain-containing protein [Pseudomonas sp. 21LCFQ010]MCO8160844.1 PAS domain-containing protein [Pseudomonas sp. 21LCFQ010]